MPLADYKADVQEITADLGETITHDGTDYTVVVSPVSRGIDLGLPGVAPSDYVEILITNDDFGTLPDRGDLITYKGREYRIDSVTDGNDDESTHLICEERNQ